jgi:hypothetical protein
VNVYACVIIIKIAMHCSIHNKTSKIVKMNFLNFCKIFQKGGKSFDALDVLYTYWEKRKALFVVR